MWRRSKSTTHKEAAARRSLSFYVTLLIALQMTSLFAFVGFVSVSDFRRDRAAATERVTEDSQRAANLISAAVAAAERSAITEAALPGYAAVFDDPGRCTVTASGSQVFGRGQFHVLRGDASVACSSTQPAGGVEGAGYAGQPWIAALDQAQQAVVAGPLDDPITGQRVLIVAAPILEVPGSVVLALEIASLADGLDAELGDRMPPSSFLVSNAEGTEVARSASLQQGVSLIRGNATAPELGWRVAAAIPTAAVYEPAWTAVRERVFFGIVVLVLLVAFAWVMHRRVAKPIRALVGALEEAATGEKVVRVPEDGPQEVRKLGKRFNRMLRERDEAEVGLVDMFENDRRQGGRREIDRMKSAFLMAVSHELRTPLAVITGYAEILQDQIADLSDEEASSIAHDIGLGAARLERLLLDILDLERMSRGMFEAQLKSTHLRGLVNRVLDFSDLRGDVKITVPNHLVVDLDPGLTERILDNLVRNAIKHTPAGTPMWIDASCKGGELELIVADAGPGIPDDLKPEVFDAFTQGKTPTHSPGTGVGLALVKQFAKLHKGRAWVDDRPGGGARFHVTFAGAVPGDVVKTTRSRPKRSLKKSA